MKTIDEKTLLEVVETLEQDAIDNAAHYGEEISDAYKKRINDLKEQIKKEQTNGNQKK